MCNFGFRHNLYLKKGEVLVKKKWKLWNICHYPYLNNIVENSVKIWIFLFLIKFSLLSYCFNLAAGRFFMVSFSSYNYSTQSVYLFQPKRILGMGLCARPTFSFVSLFVDILKCVFWHLWYIIGKLLKNSFICTKDSF